MGVTNKKAMKLWQDVFGDELWGTDCFGTWMYKDDYGIYDKKRNNRPGGNGKYYVYGWDVDHIRPKDDFDSESDADFWNNYEPMHRDNNKAKSNDYPQFTIKGHDYEVVKSEACKQFSMKGYGIRDKETNELIDWKNVQGKCYTKS